MMASPTGDLVRVKEPIIFNNDVVHVDTCHITTSLKCIVLTALLKVNIKYFDFH